MGETGPWSRERGAGPGHPGWPQDHPPGARPARPFPPHPPVQQPPRYGPPPLHQASPAYQGHQRPMWRPPLPLAEWWQRVVASTVDNTLLGLVGLPGSILLVAATSRVFFDLASTPADQAFPEIPSWVGPAFLGGLGYFLLISLPMGFWYFGWRQGATGQTLGKRLMRIRLVGLDDGRPIGTRRGLARCGLRYLLAMAGVVSIISYLWPLWDAKRQTFEDMAVKSIVVRDDLPA